jgi:hypothetical protein
MQSQRFLQTGSLLDFSDSQRLHEQLLSAIDQIQRLRAHNST